MGRQPCCDKIGIKRGPWTIEEDNKLIHFMLNNGIQCWRLVPKLAGLMRCGKSCRLRWINYLRPDLKRGAWTDAEEDMLFQLHSRLGNRWSKIAAHFPGRTDNEIKNHWNTKIKKKLKHLGLDPVTHMPNVLVDTNPDQDMQKSTCLSDDYAKPECDDNGLNTSDYEVKIKGINVSKCSSSSEGSSSVLNNDMKECPNIGYDQVLNTEWDTFMGMNQFQSQSQTYDPFQNWIHSPLTWDAFNNFQDDFI